MPESSNPDRLFAHLYLDRHITPRLAADLKNHGYDALTTQTADMSTADDTAQLAFAAHQGRAILTYNIADFATLHREWTAENRTHTRIIVSRQLSNRQYGLLLRRVTRLLNSMTADELTNNFVHLEQFK